MRDSRRSEVFYNSRRVYIIDIRRTTSATSSSTIVYYGRLLRCGCSRTQRRSCRSERIYGGRWSCIEIRIFVIIFYTTYRHFRKFSLCNSIEWTKKSTSLYTSDLTSFRYIRSIYTTHLPINIRKSTWTRRRPYTTGLKDEMDGICTDYDTEIHISETTLY